MPYPGEFARGESLWRLTESESLRRFQGIIRHQDPARRHALPACLEPPRGQGDLTRVIAIDGSLVAQAVANGYPGAEAALLLLAVIVLDLQALRTIQAEPIPRPRLFHNMERCHTLDAVLPGRNVVDGQTPGDSPRRFFRRSVYELLNARLEQGHETLRETLCRIASDRPPFRIRCPVEDCPERVSPATGAVCACPQAEPLYVTDSLRLQERFEELGANGEVFGSVRQVLETLVLLNILRFFERTDPSFFRTTAFVLDGPLAVFGLPAWMKPYVEQEITRLNAKTRQRTGTDLLLFGVEKSGHFLEHLKALDWQEGPGRRLAAPCALAPDLAYIHRHIVLRPPDAKPYGQDTYYGRKVMYKNRAGQHAVLVTPIVNAAGRDWACVEMSAFPRLGDALDLMDELATYLYEDGFVPLVRAHAHAAIPLKTGARVLAHLFERA